MRKLCGKGTMEVLTERGKGKIINELSDGRFVIILNSGKKLFLYADKFKVVTIDKTKE